MYIFLGKSIAESKGALACLRYAVLECFTHARHADFCCRWHKKTTTSSLANLTRGTSAFQMARIALQDVFLSYM